jgi:prolyl 4-hydroxylase
MSLDRLSSDWRDWLVLNVSRGCLSEAMLGDMRRGGIAPDIAALALSQALSAAVSHGAAQPESTPATPQVFGNAADGSAPNLSPGALTFQVPGATPVLRAFIERPQVAVIDNLLSDQECDHLVQLGKDSAKPVGVVDAETGASVAHPHRSGVHAHLTMVDGVLSQVENRLSILLGWPIERFENLQVIRYEPGEEYRPHFDWFNPQSSGSASHLARGGQRVGTLLMYLVVPDAGGATYFPNIGGFRAMPNRGSAVWFRNTDPSGKPDSNTLHAGDPVGQGVKWIATAWLRERAFRVA